MPFYPSAIILIKPGDLNKKLSGYGSEHDWIGLVIKPPNPAGKILVLHDGEVYYRLADLVEVL